MTSSRVTLQLDNEIQLELSADRCAWHSKSKTLFIADLHLGKEPPSRPTDSHPLADATEATLQRLNRLLVLYGPNRVIVLGDFLHAMNSYSLRFQSIMRAFWDEQSRTRMVKEWILVEGNHDRRAKGELHRWPLSIVKPPWYVDKFLCLHDPFDPFQSKTDVDCSLILAGHLHPAYRMRDHREKLPCFVLRKGCLVLPPFSEFAGITAVDDEDVEEIILIRNHQLARVDLPKRTPSSCRTLYH